MNFDFYPAIDLRGGQCVRLYKGDFDAETVYSDSPVAQAQAFESEGASWIHVVDLDAARTGEPANRKVIAKIASSVSVPIQVGGGVRTLAAAESLFEAGVTRVVVGTAALEQPELVGQIVAGGGRVAVGLDGRNGEVAVRGWTESSGRQMSDVANEFAEVGVDAVIVTEIEKDGTLDGPDVVGLAALLGATSIPVIASGGVANLDDVVALTQVAVDNKTLAGVIAGRAIYEEALTVAEAVAAIAETEAS